MSDAKRKADTDKAVAATETKLWTPEQKVPEQVRKMAFLFFLEAYKALLTGHANIQTWVAEDEYRACLKIAKAIDKVDHENDPRP